MFHFSINFYSIFILSELPENNSKSLWDVYKFRINIFTPSPTLHDNL